MPPTRAAPPGVSADNIIEGSRKRARQDNEASPSLAHATLTSANGSARAGSSSNDRGSQAPGDAREEATYKGFKLLDAVIHRKDPSDGQPLAVPFLALLSKKAFPDYYNIVKTPLSFEGVRRRLVERDFENFDAVRHTLEGVCRNAKRYNQNGSEIFEKARQLHSYIRDAYADLVEKGEVDKLPGETNASTPSLQQQSEKLAKVERPSSRARLDYDEDEEGNAVIDLRLKREDDIAYMEDGDDPGDEDDEDEDAQEDADAEDVQATATTDASTEAATGGVVADVSTGEAPALPIKRGRGRPRGSRGRGRGRGRGAGVPSMRVTLRRGGGGGGQDAAVDGVKGAMRAELEKVKGLQDKDGDDICEVFLELPSRRSYPDYYKVIATPISLEEIETSIESKAYGGPDFVADLHLMVRNAQFYNEDGSAIWEAAEQIKQHVDKVAIPNLIRMGVPMSTNGSAAVKAENGTIEQAPNASHLQVQPTSRGPSASASPLLDSKEHINARPSVTMPPSQAAMGPPPQAMMRQGSNGSGVHPNGASPVLQRPMLPTGQSPSPVPMTPAQHLRPPGQGMAHARPPMGVPTSSASPGLYPQAQAGVRPPSVMHHSQMGAAQLPRPGYPVGPPGQHSSPSPGPGLSPNGALAPQRSPQFVPRPGMHHGAPPPRPYNAGTPTHAHSPQNASALARPLRRLEGDGPLDPLSVLSVETQDGTSITRKSITGSFTVKTRGPDGQPCDALLSNKLARVHSVLVNMSHQIDGGIDIVFRLRGVVQRYGTREEPFASAPDWKLQILSNGQPLERVGYRLDKAPASIVEKVAKQVNGIADKSASSPDAAGESEADAPGSSDDGAVGEDRQVSANVQTEEPRTNVMTFASGQNGIFGVPPFSMCSVHIPLKGKGSHVVDIAVAPQPPDAGLAALTQAPPEQNVPDHIRYRAHALLNVPERYRIFLQCQ